MDQRPPMLTGYKVIDITQFVAGPTCTRLLAEMGADVVKVELAPFGDRARAQGLKAQAAARGAAKGAAPHSTYFFQHNHSKRCIALDFKHPEGRALLRTMIAQADVVVENFAPGVMARAGLSYEDLKAINPRIVMCSISLAGQSGPLADKPGYDYMGQAYAGITGLVGDPDGSPAMITMAIGDVSTGVSAALSVVAALLHRERTGEGQHVEATLVDTYFHMHEASVPRIALRGGAYEPKRTGSQHPDGGPTGIFRCGDGRYITLMSLAHQWPQLVAAMGRPELLKDERFASASLRKANNDALKDILEDWLAGVGTREECLAALEKERVPAAPVLTLSEVVAQPHLKARGTVRRVHDPAIGSFDVPGMPMRFSAWSADDGPKAGRLGEHNEEVLKAFGLTGAEIARLYAEQVLVRDATLDEASREAG
ncbi:CaiB/BaiF CoA transferase family protein [Xanthobacter pseudotagetidis]|uniref:CaiB/BaiF CoA transferase family protein n=1 Tax=Xanthobacter pseudotagetidis TaxID=3119911 RepID=UPI0037270035